MMSTVDRIATKCDVPPSIVCFENVCYRFKIHLLVFNTGVAVASSEVLVPTRITQLHLWKWGAVTANISDEIHRILVCDHLIPMNHEEFGPFPPQSQGDRRLCEVYPHSQNGDQLYKNDSNFT